MLLAVADPAWAADPIIGTWKLNVAESTFSTAMQNVPPKELTEVLREIWARRSESDPFAAQKVIHLRV